ncbi:ABC transporter substrate-binding protein [Scytonema sp. UIC 10036]|nr:ABC transporter substrate-binding protein [Scytonema sp. UIC 10036]
MNYSPNCEICGLPQEAHKLTVKPLSFGKKSAPLVAMLVGAMTLVVVAAGFGLYKLYQIRQDGDESSVASSPTSAPSSATTTPTDPLAIASVTAANAPLLSQGEKILLPNPNNQFKNSGATAFAAKNWDEAIAQYEQAAIADANDPEAKIYLNNAKAKKAGNPLTMAVGVPITMNANAAKEVLRGVALAQEQFNQAPKQPERLLEVVIVNEEPAQAASLAQDLIKYPNVLGVLGQGINNDSRQAIALYEQAELAVLSPISTSFISGSNGQSTLKTIPIAQKAKELLTTYLQSSAQTIAKYASKKQPPTVAVFYNSDSPYSQQLKDQFATSLTQVQGKVVQEIDINNPNFNPVTELGNANKAGAKIVFLALSKTKVEQAVAIAKANTSRQPLTLLASDDLYTPTLLIDGGDAIEGIVLGVPWSFQSNDPFAKEAAEIWKGRVSWRTATAYDATVALGNAFTQNPTRLGVTQLFKSGINVPSGTATNFNIFQEVPLVQAVKGKNGPSGSQYQFERI